jgi:hypothetical protein
MHRTKLTVIGLAVVAVAAWAASAEAYVVEPPGTSDAGPLIEAALDASPGGTVHLKPGHYLVSTPITIRHAVHLRGEGGPWGFAKNTWLDWRGDGALFRFSDDATRKNGFKISGMVLYGRHRFKQTAIELWTGRTFSRDLTFERVGFQRFGTALHVRRGPQGIGRIGDLLLHRCVIVDGGRAIVATEGWLNMLTVEKCTIVHNKPPAGQFVIDLRRPHVAQILRNSLEGQPRVLRIVDGRAIEAAGNQYEGNADVVWSIRNTQMHVGQEYYRRLGSEPIDPPRFQFFGCVPSGLPCPDSMLIR